ncbi:hypothetical protein MKW94_022155 [Papaver nudicaule]|uniref:MATH domain-containing protein n=1 Tax=Papaver nudicaule TaxID=74823 RepID=A0AA41SFY7_PAPNU|nr:hypothetical protein [Papaver nudicaule]
MGVLSLFNTAKHEMPSSSQVIHETVGGSHEFKIEGYSLTKGMGVGKFMASHKFRVGNYNWVIVFYPDGNVQASKEYVSVFLKLVNPDRRDVRALFEFKLLDQKGKVIHELRGESPKTFTAKGCSW